MKRTKDRKRYFSRLETALWTLAAAAVLVSFLLNDVYAFISWMNMAKRQQGSRTPCQKGDPAL